MSGCINCIDGIRISKQGFKEHKCPETLPDRAAWDKHESQQKQGREISFCQRSAAYFIGKKNGGIETSVVVCTREPPRITGKDEGTSGNSKDER